MTDSTPLSLSILDRLLDDNPGVQAEVAPTPLQAQRDLHQAVRRDLEALLNSRRRVVPYPASMQELDRSLVNYGIPDFTGASLSSLDSRAQFVRVIEAAIRRFEPRFKSVKVARARTSSPMHDTLLSTTPAANSRRFDSIYKPLLLYILIAHI